MQLKKQKKTLYLTRPIRVMVRFSKKEIPDVRARVKRSQLSMAEYGRRKFLDIPIAEIDPEQT